ncbi:class I SAM-dependent methyltransferase [Roseobacter sp. GAI101]|uniref:class I SAM-dependent methyltransferase n=1 Tax=Roseobacter sp. (strain GAI101) TaxID=391589 RepID=UPI00018717E4|nr:methyltransferase domain-containing protein [Roseobacter sp. GAI101]EEB82513.1 methyltransferase type 12, putative [Roseobacter sp. GAI101]
MRIDTPALEIPLAVREDYHALVRTEVLKLVPEGENNVLDVGGGIGASSAYLKSTGKAVRATVVDLVGTACLPQIDRAFGGDLEDPSLLEQVARDCGPFDVILCLDVLEHLSDPWTVVGRLSDMLVPGGVIVASIPNVRNYRLLGPLLFQGRFELVERGILDRTHLRWFVGGTAKALMSRGSLQVDVFQKFFEGPRKTLFNTLTLGLFHDFLTIQFYIRSVKQG